jgi:hypothetical protein
MGIDISSSVEKAIGNAADNVTNNLSKNIGQTLGDIWFLIFGGISQCAEMRKLKYSIELEKFKKELEHKISRIPKKRRTQATLQNIGPALDKAKYCVEESILRNMFANLIASILDSNYSGHVLPCFAGIIEQMTPLDADNITYFVQKQQHPIASYVLSLQPNGKKIIKYNVFLSNPREQNLERQAISISNLTRLGLIGVDYNNCFTDETYYKSFYETPYYLEVLQKLQSGSLQSIGTHSVLELLIEKGNTYTTPLGNDFITICVQE